MTAAPGPISGGALVYPGTGDFIYGFRGNATTTFYRYSISGNSWTTMTAAPGTIGNGGALVYPGTGVFIYGFAGNATSNFYRFNLQPYYSSGTFTSGVIDTGAKSNFTTLAFSVTTPVSTTATIDVRAGNTATPDGTWTSWQTNIANSGSISALNGNRYMQYRANLSTTDTNITSSLDSITINYGQAPVSATLTSSIYDTSDNGNILSKIVWNEDATFGAGANIQFQMRSAATSGGISSATFVGTDGTASTYFDHSGTGCSKVSTTVTCNISRTTILGDGSGDRYFQYKVFFASDGVNIGTLSDVTFTYVVNAVPDFDATFGNSGVSASQISTSTDPNWGKVQIQYKVRDTDTLSGTTNPGFVTPSFEYSLNGGTSWTAISSSYLATGDVSNKAVTQSTYNLYTATWNAVSQLGSSTYNTTVKVRVTINDNEAANNTANQASANFTLDINPPTNTFTFNSTTGMLSIALTDDSNLQYNISNNSDLSADGVNSSSGAWQSVGATSLTTSTSWTPAGVSPAYQTLYAASRDVLGNSASTTPIVIPYAPQAMQFKDISNPTAGTYKEFITWSIYVSTTNAAFASYKVYRSTNGTTYTLLSTITDVNQNYLVDQGLSSTTTYYYKVVTTDTDGDVSNYSTIVSDKPNGQGGTDVTPPTISAVAISNIQSSTATVTWTTDELSDSKVEYSIDTGYGLSQSVNTMSTSHSVSLTNLLPNTAYRLRVKSTDPSSNVGTDDNAGAGYTFITSGGPIISGVTTINITDKGATIFWNTNKASDSFVKYALGNTIAVATATAVGSATLVSVSSNPLIFQHQVTLTGLAAGSLYYYQVASTDSLARTTIDTNGGLYYAFQTSLDTKPPVISNLGTPVISSNSAVIFWSTDEPATSVVDYGTVSKVYTTILNPAFNFDHSIALQPLTAKTTYYYRVHSSDIAGNEAISLEQSFTTTSAGETIIVAVGGGGGGSTASFPDTTPPTITDIAVKEISASGAKVSFKTSEDSIAFIRYGEKTEYGGVAADYNYSSDKTIPLKGLKTGTLYHLRVEAIDKAGNRGVSDDKTFTTLELKINDVKVKDIGPFGANVNFITTEDTLGFIHYGETTLYAQTIGEPSNSDGNYSTDKTIQLKGLKMGTLYHLQAEGIDKEGNRATSDDITFTTKFATDALNNITVSNVSQFQDQLEQLIQSALPSLFPPFLDKPRVKDIGENTATIEWTTNIPAFASVGYVEDDQYNATAEKPYTHEVSKAETKETSHSLILLDLKPNTLYHYQARSFRLPEVVGKTPDLTFITKSSIIKPRALDIGLDAMSIVWSTPEPTNSIVTYKNLTTGETSQKLSDEKTTSHSVRIVNLILNTPYRINVKGYTQKENLIEGEPFEARTKNDITPPHINSLNITSTLVPGRTDRVQMVLRWETDKPSTAVVFYQEGTQKKTGDLANQLKTENIAITRHSAVISTLRPGTLYQIQIRSTDVAGNVDTSPPHTVITPTENKSIIDIVIKNLEDTFKFLK